MSDTNLEQRVKDLEEVTRLMSDVVIAQTTEIHKLQERATLTREVNMKLIKLVDKLYDKFEDYYEVGIKLIVKGEPTPVTILVNSKKGLPIFKPTPSKN